MASEDLRAEQFAAIVRLVIALSLLVFFGAIVLYVGRINYWLAGVCTANAVLACCSVYVTRRKIFRRWFPWLISAADAAFLFGVGWFGPWLHVLPAGFAFALISQWAVFLVLTIEALRARSATILYQTGLICGLLIVLAWWPTDVRLYSTYGVFEQLFSNSSNAARLAIIFLSGLTLAAGARRSRSALKRAIIASRQRSALQRFHAREITHKIASDDLQTLLAGRRHRVCIMFADLRGFTNISENMPPERVVQLLTSFRARSERVIYRHGGAIEKFIGDGFLAIFGLTGPQRHDARNAVNAALSLLQEIDNWSRKRISEGREPVSVSVGLHCGDAFIGIVGNDRMEFTVIGDAVNVAQRLEALTRESQCLLIASESVLSDADFDPNRLVGCKVLANLKLRGRAVNLTAYGGYPIAV